MNQRESRMLPMNSYDRSFCRSQPELMTWAYKAGSVHSGVVRGTGGEVVDPLPRQHLGPGGECRSGATAGQESNRGFSVRGYEARARDHGSVEPVAELEHPAREERLLARARGGVLGHGD